MNAPVDRYGAGRRVADAVLYEGYVLYPYRASSKKNQVRWQFGVLAPRPYAEASGAEAWVMRAECLAETGRASASISALVRFLQIRSRRLEQALGTTDHAGEPQFEPVEKLDLAGELYTSWDEAVEHEIECPAVALADLVAGAEAVTPLALAAAEESELLYDETGAVGGRLTRTCLPVAGQVLLRGEDLGFGMLKIVAEVQNLTDWEGSAPSRDEVMQRSLAGAHLLLALDQAGFVSLLDPPARARRAVAECASKGCFPVLCGPETQDDLVLCSPIILYDHPEVAPESPGDMCDATEIDEILALRTLTLTEEEKREARATDARAASIVDRVDSLPPEIFERLHGAIRSLRPIGRQDGGVGEAAGTDSPLLVLGRGDDFDEKPWAATEKPWWDPGVDSSVDPESDTVIVGSLEVGRGAKVRLHPGRRSDAQDMFLRGQTATVAGVFHDVDGDVHLAVTLDHDPAAEMTEWYGRFRYFRPEEIEVLEVGS